jgi:hypothetical protein
MNMKDAKELRERWGDKPCDHPDLAKEMYFGGSTGDYVCTQCGEAFWHAEAKEMLRGREQKKKK